MITAHLTQNTITSTSEDAFSLCEKSCWGEKNHNHIEYSFVEALALVEEDKMEIWTTKKLSLHELHRKLARLDKRIDVKHAAFSDLRKRGYIVKTALKFGAEFRVYDKGAKPGQEHAAWLLFPVKEREVLTWYEFAAKNRIATSTKKKLMLGIVDDEGDVIYYEVSWLRP